MSVNRRELLHQLLRASFATSLATHEPLWSLIGRLTSAQGRMPFRSRDAFDILADYATLGSSIPLQHAKGAARSLWNQLQSAAHAQTEDDELCVITIKVMNLWHTPLMFNFPKYTGSNDELKQMQRWDRAGKLQALSSAGLTGNQSFEFLIAKGLNLKARLPRFGAMYLNEWFAELLNSGKDELGQVSSLIRSGEIGAFPAESDVALQCFLHINQNNVALNHSFQNTALLKGNEKGQGGDLGHHLDHYQLVNSPLGIVCLNSNGQVETTDGYLSGNRVVGSDLKELIALGREPESYVSLMQNAIGNRDFASSELSRALDGMVDPNYLVRDPITQSLQNLSVRLDDIRSAASLMTEARHMAEGTLNSQKDFGTAANRFANNQVNPDEEAGGDFGEVAKSGFIGQCLFVSRMLDVVGKPMRNFTLICPVMDQDGRPLNAVTKDPVTSPFSNVEGIRQLGQGLNILAHAIRRHKNVFVTVISEGGRNHIAGDNKVSHAFLMGPGSGKYAIRDFLYADKVAVKTSSDPYVVEPNEGNATTFNSPGLSSSGHGLRLYSDPVLVADDGSPVHSSQFGNTAAVLGGLVAHIEEAQGRQSSSIKGKGMGNRFVIQKKES